MAKKIKALTYIWNGHTCYLGKINYSELKNVVDIKSDLSMNREIDEKRVEKIIDYLESEDILNAFFPPAVLSSSVKLIYNPKLNELDVKEGKFTVIDGQHRIDAIIRLEKRAVKDTKKKLNKMELPVLIIEGLENYQHRNLFFLINETAKKVDSNISERFSEKLENLVGLRFLSENPELCEYIEWEKRQSFDENKITYIHLTDCIRELHNEIYNNLKDHFSGSPELLYKDDHYYDIMSFFLQEVISYIINLEDGNRSFFTRKTTLRAIVLDVCDEISRLFKTIRASSLNVEECVTFVKDSMKLSFLFTLNPLHINYIGETSTRISTYKTTRYFLVMNGYISIQRENLDDVIPLIQKVIDSYFDSDKKLELSNDDYSSYYSMVNNIVKELDDLSKLDLEKLNSIEFNREMQFEKIVEILKEEDEVNV